MRNQRGIALSGLIFWSVVLILLAVLAMKVVPTTVEYFKIVKATQAVVKNASPDATVLQLREAFQKYAEVDDIKLPARELEIYKDRGQLVIEFSYEKRIPLFANVSLLIDYRGSTAD
jgi:hypothetical protein